MATSANLTPGAIPANGHGDPFVGPGTGALRYGSFDTDHFSMYSSKSPSHARRALEAHLRDTDRRLQDASKLGSTLLQQRKDLSARLEEVKQVQQDDELPTDLRKKLTELEREYNEIGKESARAFLTRPKAAQASENGATPTVLSGQARESPTKVSAPSRKQRNQPSSRVHDIEFATEISTSLLAQVRQLQAALAERDETLRETASAKARLEAEATGLVGRIKQMGEHEQRYKDDSWNLEMKIQELEGSLRETTDKHDRVHQSLRSVESEKTAAQRELDDLRVIHDKLNEDHAANKRQQEVDMHSLRRDVATHQTERQTLQKKIDDLTAQNTELARALSSHWSQPSEVADHDLATPMEEDYGDDLTPEHSEPPSPVKGTPRHGMLESETLKSSLNHAHRMIQNLKNNIHREKTEKVELKRMLQDARDELEARRGETGVTAANMAKKRSRDTDSSKFKRPARPDRLGANRSSTTEVMEDEPDWEDHEGQSTPSKSRFPMAAAGVVAGVGGIATFEHVAIGGAETDATDAFETANERDTTTETETFETGNEDLGADDSDLTETEGGLLGRSGTVRGSGVTPLVGAKVGRRRSLQSTASASDDEAENVSTPVQSQQPKYRLRMSRGNRPSSRLNDVLADSPSLHSPSSSVGTPQPAGPSLGDELNALDDGSLAGTPSRLSIISTASPETERQMSLEPETPAELDAEDGTPEGEQAQMASQANAAMLAHEFATRKANMVDAGVMTDPWEPEKETIVQKQTLTDRAGELVGGALAGFGIGRIGQSREVKDEPSVEDAPLQNVVPTSIAHDTTEGGAGPTQELPAVLPTAATAADDSVDVKQPHPLDDVQEAGVEMVKEPKSLAGAVSGPLMEAKEANAAPESKVVAPFETSSIVSQDTVPSLPHPSMSVPEHQASTLQQITATASNPAVPLTAAAPFAVNAGRSLQDFSFSAIDAQTLEPTLLPEASPMLLSPSMPLTPLTPNLPRRSSRRLDSLLDDGEQPAEAPEYTTSHAIPGTDAARPGASFFFGNMPPPLTRTRSRSMPAKRTDEALPMPSPMPIPKPLQIRKAVSDEGSQTTVSGAEIDDMLYNKSRTSSMVSAVTDPGYSPSKLAASPQRRSMDGMAPGDGASPSRAPRRPASATALRGKGAVGAAPPPLPEDFTQKITAAQKVPSAGGPAAAGTMGPPLMPASAYRQNRAKTPVDRSQDRSLSRDGTTPRAVRPRDSKARVHSPSRASRRTSVSSFASELDERFNITRGDLIYPSDVTPATDPRMIQAITQTMIGEYLWKYTRKAGRSEKSNTRHRRFFWVHPYTRTLYWSEQDPSTAGRNMLKAKSMAITAVRVITDDNSYPPGLHRKSIVVVTPGREIVFTAPTGQRHETWFNALSYLLLRTEQEKQEAEDTFNQDDINEFNPGFSIRRSISRLTGRDRSHDRASLSSYNSRTTRTSSPQRREAGGSLAQRHASRTSTMRDSTSIGGGRLNSLTSRFRPSSSLRGSFSTNRARSSFSVRGRGAGDPSDIYDASVIEGSAEDLRNVIERQEREADRLENVRACCDGKHDVGSLSRSGRHSSMSSRVGSQSHSHGHSHPRAEPMKDSARPRRGE
ncbi:hypothetical protein BAUCODRAFT_65546 [Baudoinia panamericana UAMH 10762]|uniref:PH domain-containing protein n=1 Tax=Baudoinia panamericana (strain UAMH 10762) TaxID=717646 RepID=M2NI33_BAUPA|nr:uncharacterized protein BAUCODRAFT_65546 [Baudoinia panamericana UAMH 10762]EMC98750.1 hypothetical protein BAUCODRAFT_65546 [Baudoinia panamericana UAMH 10762]